MKKLFNKERKKSILISVFMIASIMSCFTMTAYAVFDPHVEVSLTPSMKVAYTDTVVGTHKYFAGFNRASSAHRVYFESQKSNGSGFKKDVQILVSPGAEIDDIRTGSDVRTTLWRLELNPYGVGTKNCSGGGYMWLDN